MKKILISTWFVFAFFWANSQLIPATFYTTKDAYTISSDLTNYGNDVQMEAGIYVNKLGTATFRRSYTEIQMSGIPADAIIVSAQLMVYQNSGLTASTSTDLYVERITSSWDESVIKAGTEPSVSSSEIVTSSSYASNWRSFDVKAHVQKMVNGGYTNLGWRIRYFNETQTTANLYKFQTSDGANAPKLVINYYLPLKINSVVFNHCSTTLSTDGSITPAFENGCGSTYTYEWYNSGGLISSETGSSINNRSSGWYGLHAYNTTYNDHLYMAFILGVNCVSTTVDFNPGPNFIDDAPIANGIPPVGTPPYVTTNYGNSLSLLSQTSTQISVMKYNNFLRFRLWMDPNLVLSQADLLLVGKSHSSGGQNAATLLKVTSPWSENVVTWNNSPTSDASIQTNVPETISTTEPKTIDILNFWNFWQNNNNSNFGVRFQLQNSTSTTRRMEFHSSDVTTENLRPSIQFIVSVDNLVSGTITAGSNAICSGSTTLLTLNGYTAGATFQWQKSTIDSDTYYTDIAGATNSTYLTLSSTTVNTYYRCVVSFGPCSTKKSPSQLITIKPIPSVSVSDAEFCSGNDVQLTAIPSLPNGTYLWNNGLTANPVSVSPLVSTTYSVVYTLDGCPSAPDSANVQVCQQYAKLERMLTGINYNVFAFHVNFYFDNEYTSASSWLNYVVYPADNKFNIVMSSATNPQPLSFGNNRYKLNTQSLSTGAYIIEVQNDKKEKFYLRFIR